MPILGCQVQRSCVVGVSCVFGLSLKQRNTQVAVQKQLGHLRQTGGGREEKKRGAHRRAFIKAHSRDTMNATFLAALFNNQFWLILPYFTIDNGLDDFRTGS